MTQAGGGQVTPQARGVDVRCWAGRGDPEVARPELDIGDLPTLLPGQMPFVLLQEGLGLADLPSLLLLRLLSLVVQSVL